MIALEKHSRADLLSRFAVTHQPPESTLNVDAWAYDVCRGSRFLTYQRELRARFKDDLVAFSPETLAYLWLCAVRPERGDDDYHLGVFDTKDFYSCRHGFLDIEPECLDSAEQFEAACWPEVTNGRDERRRPS